MEIKSKESPRGGREGCAMIETFQREPWIINGGSVCAVSNEKGSQTMVMDKGEAIKKRSGWCVEKEKMEGSANIREDQTWEAWE